MLRLTDAGLFDDGEPEPTTEEVIPVTLDLLKRQFIHRWGYNATAQHAMAPELDELIAFARRHVK